MNVTNGHSKTVTTLSEESVSRSLQSNDQYSAKYNCLSVFLVPPTYRFVAATASTEKRRRLQSFRANSEVESATDVENTDQESTETPPTRLESWILSFQESIVRRLPVAPSVTTSHLYPLRGLGEVGSRLLLCGLRPVACLASIGRRIMRRIRRTPGEEEASIGEQGGRGDDSKDLIAN